MLKTPNVTNLVTCEHPVIQKVIIVYSLLFNGNWGYQKIKKRYLQKNIIFVSNLTGLTFL